MHRVNLQSNRLEWQFMYTGFVDYCKSAQLIY